MSITMRDFSTREEWLAARKELGVGASEVATVCGANPYQSALQLWEERTGKREKKENDAMRRGHEMEPRIRDRVMQRWSDYFDLQYNEFGMWLNTDYPNQFATLDGILIAKEDNPAVNIGGVVIPVKKGERIILEIKSSAPPTIDAYRRWNEMPTTYVYQAAAQMMCSGIDKHILVADLQGIYARNPFDERFFFHTRYELESVISEIAESVPKFFSMQTNNVAPDQGVDLAGAVIKVTPVAGTISDNLDEFKALVELCAERYRGLTFTESQYAEAKKTRAELAKAVKEINEKRISVSKIFDEPYKAFKARCDEIVKIITDVAEPIDAQVKAFEQAEDERKKVAIAECIKNIVDTRYSHIKPLLEFASKGMAEGTNILGVKFNPKWLNRTYKMTAIETDVDTFLRNVGKEYETLYSLKDSFGDMWDAIYAEYISSGLSLVAAINKKNQLVEARQAQLEMERRQEEQKASQPEPEPTPIPEPEPEPEPVPQPIPEMANPIPEEKIYTKCVEFSHTNVSEFGALVAYLKQHGFKCREIKEYK